MIRSWILRALGAAPVVRATLGELERAALVDLRRQIEAEPELVRRTALLAALNALEAARETPGA